jgi:hypothetical protein
MIRMTLVMAIAHQGLVVVVVISSVEGGRPEAGLAVLGYCGPSCLLDGKTYSSGRSKEGG